MASSSTYECDGCGCSIPDPSVIGALDLTTYDLKNGGKYVGDSYKAQQLDLCASCTSVVKKLLRRAFPGMTV